MSDKEPLAPALGVSVKFNFPMRELIFQTHVDRDESIERLNALVDKVSKIGERQGKKQRLGDMKKELEINENRLRDMVEDRDRLDKDAQQQWVSSERKGPFKLNQQQAAARNNAEITRVKGEEIISRVKAEIAQLERDVAEGV